MSTQDQLKEFRKSFNLFDTRGNGKIEYCHVAECLRLLGLNPSKAELQKCMKGLNPNEAVTFDGFLIAVSTALKLHQADQANEFIEALGFLDRAHTGLISAQQLRHLLTTFGEPLSQMEVDALFVGNVNEEGQVNYRDFVHMLFDN